MSARADTCDSCSATVVLSSVFLRPGGSATAIVNVTAAYWWGGSDVAFGVYDFQAPYPVSVVSYNLTVVFGETLILQNYAFTSNLNVTLSVENNGRFALGVLGYEVGDAAGDIYSCSGLQNCLVSSSCCSPFSVGHFSISIGASCPKCVLTGTGFTFTMSKSYSITITTSTGIFYDPYGPTVYLTIQR